MPKFELHLLAGALLSLVFYNQPVAGIALLLGSVFPDIDCRKSISHKSLLAVLAVMSMATLYQLGLEISILATIILVATFIWIMPKHRGWMHGIPGQLLFSAICFLATFNILVAVTAFIGTSLHRLMDGA